MHTFDVQEILRRTLSGASRQAIAGELGISKSTVQRYLDRIKQANLTLEQAIGLNPNDLESRLGVGTGVRSGFHEPDFETVYCRHNVHGKNRRTLKALWDSYRDSVPKGASALGYKGFCKAYARFCQNLPPSCREVELTNQWDFGYVAMIDYSGDTLPWTPDGVGKVTEAQIFVGVLPASGYIFCCATERQTRDDWLDAQVKMLSYFGGVPKHIYLDNSTSLVAKADKYCPRLCRQYREFCDYYGTIPVAVRPGKPRDKAMVENAVYQCQRFILTALRGRQFFSLEEINRAIGKELAKLNARPLTTRSDGFSRADLMQEEKITLRPLPSIPYELSSVSKILKVQKSNVVRFENCRYSVPLGYLGRQVKVIKSCKSQTISIFDLRTGERIWIHYLRDSKSQDIILREHMPETIRAVMLTKAELIELIGQSGEAARKLCTILLKQNHGEIGRKVLRGVNSHRTRLGNELFEKCCQATLTRLTPSYKVLCEEIDSVIDNRTRRSDGKSCDRSQLRPEEIRGSAYYDQLLTQTTGETK